jgi:hypothetical protein
MTSEEREAYNIKKELEDLLTPKCPCCKVAFVVDDDFKECAALKCQTEDCRASGAKGVDRGYCAWCLKQFDDHLHDHVGQCTKRADVADPLYPGVAELQRHLEQHQTQLILERLERLPQQMKERVIKLSPLLQGIQADNSSGCNSLAKPTMSNPKHSSSPIQVHSASLSASEEVVYQQIVKRLHSVRRVFNYPQDLELFIAGTIARLPDEAKSALSVDKKGFMDLVKNVTSDATGKPVVCSACFTSQLSTFTGADVSSCFSCGGASLYASFVDLSAAPATRRPSRRPSSIELSGYRPGNPAHVVQPGGTASNPPAGVNPPLSPHANNVNQVNTSARCGYCFLNHLGDCRANIYL